MRALLSIPPGARNLRACRALEFAVELRGMDRATASNELREHCKTVGLAVMKMHPLLKDLGDDATKGEIVKSLFEITKNVEVVKKQVMRLEKRDDSALL